ncbi:MAG TPA: hypothetical protein VIH35_01580 [Kiritimatiellia bacterium]|jgi:hypothetical protein
MNTNNIIGFPIRVYSCLSRRSIDAKADPFVVEMKNPSVWISALLGLLFVAAGLWMLLA